MRDKLESSSNSVGCEEVSWVWLSLPRSGEPEGSLGETQRSQVSAHDTASETQSPAHARESHQPREVTTVLLFLLSQPSTDALVKQLS